MTGRLTLPRPGATSVHVGIPVIFNYGDKIDRTGASFHADCPRCAQVVKMYEAKKRFNVSLFWAVSLWDSDESIVQCGECLGIFEKENAALVRAAAREKPSIVASVMSSLRPKRSTPPPDLPAAEKAPESRRLPPPSRRPPIDEASIDAELAAMKRRLGK